MLTPTPPQRIVHIVLSVITASAIIGPCSGYMLDLGPCFLQYLEPCTDEVIQYYLFSSARPQAAPIALDAQEPDVPDWVDLRVGQTKVIVHGYGGNLDFYATKAIRDAYLTRNHTNVIIADWGKLAQLPCYPTAVLNTRQAGECLGAFLVRLRPAFGGAATKTFLRPTNTPKPSTSFERMHLVGFSLGAHVASFASNIVRQRTGILFDRLTGLDPALPLFTTIHRDSKLDRTDARFVDVVHTNAGVFGKIEPSGHIDFYLNGGQTQPACIDDMNAPLCSHMLSTIYFAESITSQVGFWGMRCTSYVSYALGWCRIRSIFRTAMHQMGEHCDRTSHGIIFIDTSANPPYALGL